MKRLTRNHQIWTLSPENNDLQAGAEYASISLPWTFNRMMLTTSSKGQQSRALNIAKGIVAQEILKRHLKTLGISAKTQRKSYRDEDLFDFRIQIDDNFKKLDLKTFNYYSNYPDMGREPLSRLHIINNRAYPGPDWRKFFPMLVPHTQIEQSKEAYCFAIASSIDLRNDIDTDRIGYALTAFPYGLSLIFMSSKRLCLAREDERKGFFVDIEYSNDSLFANTSIEIIIIGEWDGGRKEELVTLRSNERIREVGPFSSITSFRIDREKFVLLDNGSIQLRVSRNQLQREILNSSFQNINQKPATVFELTKSDFCNLILPSNYKIYFLGWITKEEFLETCKSYDGWVWPINSIDKYCNQPWSQITARDMKTLKKLDLERYVQNNPRWLRAGLMKTHGRGGGACCYVFPNIGKNGGVKETNLYVLPKDLNIMDEIKGY